MLPRAVKFHAVPILERGRGVGERATARDRLTARKATTLLESRRRLDGGSLYLAIDGEGDATSAGAGYLFHWNGGRREVGV